ncbi:hypothetical protein GCM10017559_71960 [Streptosporangium longisporum]|uniref:Response regulatory domain-containing protein n=1 Tax=Streptosporangium longisporum TaxID=46187 RepID=A0ABP6L8J7_9ACTN
MRLLVVEDEEDLVDALRVGLVRAGYAVDVAYDVAQAREKLQVNSYDLVLLDLNLPGRGRLRGVPGPARDRPGPGPCGSSW